MLPFFFATLAFHESGPLCKNLTCYLEINKRLAIAVKSCLSSATLGDRSAGFSSANKNIPRGVSPPREGTDQERNFCTMTILTSEHYALIRATGDGRLRLTNN